MGGGGGWGGGGGGVLGLRKQSERSPPTPKRGVRGRGVMDHGGVKGGEGSIISFLSPSLTHTHPL